MTRRVSHPPDDQSSSLSITSPLRRISGCAGRGRYQSGEITNEALSVVGFCC